MARRRAAPPSYLIVGLVALVALPLVALWVAKFGVGPVLALALAFLTLEVALPYWVFRDAAPGGRARAVRWTAAAFLLPLVGFLAYLAARRVAA